jgi:hypothetical protein
MVLSPMDFIPFCPNERNIPKPTNAGIGANATNPVPTEGPQLSSKLMIATAESAVDVTANVHQITSRRLSAVMPQRQSVPQPFVLRPLVRIIRHAKIPF